MNEEQQIGSLIEPSPIAFSFGAPGWYMLLALIFIILGIMALIVYLKHRKRKYRRQAIVQLEQLNSSTYSSTTFLAQTMETIKRVAITTYGREGLIHLNGIQFLDLLQEKNKGEAVFSKEIQKLFLSGLYQSQNIEFTTENKNRLIKECITWIDKHHV